MWFYFIRFLLFSPLIVSVARFHPHMQNKYYSSQNRNKKYAYNCKSRAISRIMISFNNKWNEICNPQDRKKNYKLKLRT